MIQSQFHHCYHYGSYSQSGIVTDHLIVPISGFYSGPEVERRTRYGV